MSGYVATAPLRVDLAGGTLDLWPLSVLHEDASTVNVALSLRARATYRPGNSSWIFEARDHDARLTVPRRDLRRAAAAASDGDFFALVLKVLDHLQWNDGGNLVTSVDGPPGGGLAGSSALMVALLGLAHRATQRRLDRQRCPQLARDLEARVLGLPTGVQDYYPAIHGGALHLEYGPGATRCTRLDFDVAGLEARAVLAYSGKPHASAPSNWSIYRRRLEGEPVAVESFASIARAASRAASALRCSDWAALGEAMTADWAARKHLDPALAPPTLRELEQVGLAAGARAAKCCGAASGGTMLFLLRRTRDREAVESALEAAGARILPFAVARSGLTVRGT
jgi:D-glycero-alpha-D-manno-heptose-7-phosphate kinase